ncbi:hypothetical protein PIB30_037998 [Stylosanthes scabra]|uniref:Uncharacterized protein n=1 Tax=Stylosanthes scabra TaxID=79078 RepID=A0ABU6QDC4_9FABA|nr:hypothetical protein [Stylosanthes scabra]
MILARNKKALVGYMGRLCPIQQSRLEREKEKAITGDHTMSKATFMRPEEYAHNWLTIEAYNSAYEWTIQPVLSQEFWQTGNHAPLMPPVYRKPIRRPTLKRNTSRDGPRTNPNSHKYCFKVYFPWDVTRRRKPWEEAMHERLGLVCKAKRLTQKGIMLTWKRMLLESKRCFGAVQNEGAEDTYTPLPTTPQSTQVRPPRPKKKIPKRNNLKRPPPSHPILLLLGLTKQRML